MAASRRSQDASLLRRMGCVQEASRQLLHHDPPRFNTDLKQEHPARAGLRECVEEASRGEQRGPFLGPKVEGPAGLDAG